MKHHMQLFILPVLLLLLPLLLIQTTEAKFRKDGFIKTNGFQFTLNEAPFYGNGFNAYWLMSVASDPSQRSKVSSAFKQAAAHKLFIARAWAFGDGGYYGLQKSPGVYDEQMFQGLDFVISEARKYKMKLILSLVNNYDEYGGKQKYVDWARSRGEPVSASDHFFTNPLVKTFYKDHVKMVLTRMNKITGIAYKDDPTIMAWELMNEVRCPSDESGRTVQDWIAEMASYVKSIDSNHLLEAGLEGFYSPSSAQKQLNIPYFTVGTDFIKNNLIPDIDFATVHSYPDYWLPHSDDKEQLSFLTNWVNGHIDDAQNILKKPLLFAEFGKSMKDAAYTVEERNRVYNTVYSAVYDSARRGGVAAGSMFWQLMSEGMDNFRDGYEVVLSENQSTASLIRLESEKMYKIRKMYARIRDVEIWNKAHKH